jgi:hypothetical protein
MTNPEKRLLLVKGMMHKRAISVVAALLLLTSCGPASRAPIPGRYEFRDGQLELLKNLTYRLCVGSKPCEIGIYDLEAPRVFPDGTNRLCEVRKPNSCGKALTNEDSLITRIYFDPGVKGPMKRFNYPPTGEIINGMGEDITTRESEAANVEYDVWGQPMFTFMDPDSGLYFHRVSG